MHDCTFKDNVATDYTSALRIGGTLTKSNVTSCSFFRNQMLEAFIGGTGGGVLVVDFNMEARISNCSFVENTGDGNAAILVLCSGYTSPRIISNCTCNRNSARYSSTIEIRASIATIENCTIDSNEYGGILAIAPSLSTSSFTNNVHTTYSAATFLNSIANVVACTFDNNIGNTSGAIFSSGAQALVSYSTVTSNDGRMNGGGIAVSDSTSLLPSHSIFSNNTATNGGAIYIDSKGVSVSDDVQSYNNKATGTGGCLVATRLLLRSSQISMPLSTRLWSVLDFTYKAMQQSLILLSIIIWDSKLEEELQPLVQVSILV